LTRTALKIIVPLALVGVVAAVVVASGTDAPPESVAKVGDSSITKDEFDEWLAAAVKNQTKGGTAVVPNPPDFEKCVAAKRPKSSAPGGTLKKRCRSEYDALKSQVMPFLIQAEWVQQEAEQRGIEVTDAAVRKLFERQRERAFPTDKAYLDFLEKTGMTEEKILFRVRLDQLQQKLTQKVTGEAKAVTAADIKAYYESNMRRFAQPEVRNLRVVLTKTEARAEEARQALENGVPWKRVAQRFSIDEAWKAEGGRMPPISKGEQEPALDKAAFDAPKGELEGPIKTPLGWYVFEVEKITRSSTLEDATPTIEKLLRKRHRQRALDAFLEKFREEYTAQTDCATDYRVAGCKNAPKQNLHTDEVPGGAHDEHFGP
jgi:foldase protein PrsA